MIRSLKNGFTLVEIMIVIAIIGILFSVAMPHFHDAIQRARRNKCYEFSSFLTRTCEVYHIENYKYPEKIEDLIPYLEKRTIPQCPSGGQYRWVPGTVGNPVESQKVECSIHGCATATWGG